MSGTSSWTSGLLTEKVIIKVWSTALREREYRDQFIKEFKELFSPFGILLTEDLSGHETLSFDLHGDYKSLGNELRNLTSQIPKRRMRELWFPLDIFLQTKPGIPAEFDTGIPDKYYWNSSMGFCEGTWG